MNVLNIKQFYAMQIRDLIAAVNFGALASITAVQNKEIRVYNNSVQLELRAQGRRAGFIGKYDNVIGCGRKSTARLDFIVYKNACNFRY